MSPIFLISLIILISSFTKAVKNDAFYVGVILTKDSLLIFILVYTPRDCLSDIFLTNCFLSSMNLIALLHNLHLAALHPISISLLKVIYDIMFINYRFLEPSQHPVLVRSY